MATPRNPGNMVIISGMDHDELTEEEVKNLLKSNGLADANDIQHIEILDGLNMAIITLFNTEVKKHNDETKDRWTRSLIVDGIDESQMSVLLLLVTNKSKGGGELDDSHIDPDSRRVLLTFKEKHVAEQFLAVGFISLLGKNFTVSQPSLIEEEDTQSSVTLDAVEPHDSWEQICPMAEDMGTPFYMRVSSEQSGDTGYGPGGVHSNIVVVREVPDVLTEEKLKNLLESNDLADAEDIKQVEFRRDTKIAKITLLDPKVAAKICRRQTVNFKDKVLLFSLEPKEDVDDSDNVFDGDGTFDTLKVTGVNASVSDEMLRMYFENPIRSGGGPVGDMSPLTNGECIVKFQDPKVASTVFHRKLHQLDGVSFSVVPLEKVEVTKCCAIEVEGLGKGHSEDLLKLYFEHQKFGEATVEDVVIDRLRGKAVVTFKNPQDVENVLSHKNHVLSNVPLTLTQLDPSPPVPLLLEQTEDTRLLATGLPPRTKLSDLQKYFGKLSGVRLTAAYLMNIPTKCLLEFEATPDYKRLRDLVNAKPFRGVMISIRKVPLATSIEVLGVCDLSDEILTLFFENRQHGKGKVVEIRRQPEQGRTFIKFEKPDVISGLLKKTLKLEGRTLKVCWHHSFLDAGSIPLVDVIPGRQKSGSFQSLPPMRSRVLSEPSLGLHHVAANQTASMRPSMMLFEEGEGEITPTASLVDLTAPEKMENLKPYHNRLLMLIGFEKQLVNDAGSTQTKITLEEVSLLGSEESRASMKIKVLEKLMSMIVKVQHVSEVKGRLMRRDSVQEYVHGICQQRDIKATLASDPTLQVCAFDEKENAKLENLLPSLIKEQEFSLDVSNTAAAALSDDLKKRQEEIEFIIDAVQKKITLACLDKDEVQIRELIEKFIKDNSRLENRISLNQQRKDFIWQHRTEDVEPLRKELEKSGGSIEYELGTVIVKGDSSSVNSASTRLQQIIDSLVEKSYTVDHPGGESFLTKTAPGKLILKGVESEDKVFITVRSRAPRTLSTNRERAAEPDIVSSTSGSSSADVIMSRVANDAGIVVTVVTGTVESQKVNAIVNSTSRDLVLDRGEISKSILVSAGPSIQDECQRTSSSIEFGNVIRTKGYTLPSKCVYHGAALEWDGAKGKALQVLKSFIRNCLQQANTDGQKSMAFPAIGAGTLKIPADVVVKTLFEGVETFSRQHPETSLKDIRFVIFAQNQHVAAAFKSKLESLRSSSGGCWKPFVRQTLKVNETKTSLTVLASSEKATQDVFKKIEDILKDQTAEDRIDSTPDIEVISFLVNEQIRSIQDLQSTHSVAISLEPSPPSNHILVIKGTPKDVASVGRIVRQIIYNNL